MSEPINTVTERITTVDDGPTTVNEHRTDGGPGRHGVRHTAVERLSGSDVTDDADAAPSGEKKPRRRRQRADGE